MVCNNTRHGQTALSFHFPPAAGNVISHLGPHIHRCPAVKKSDTRIPILLRSVLSLLSVDLLSHMVVSILAAANHVLIISDIE